MARVCSCYSRYRTIKGGCRHIWWVRHCRVRQLASTHLVSPTTRHKCVDIMWQSCDEYNITIRSWRAFGEIPRTSVSEFSCHSLLTALHYSPPSITFICCSQILEKQVIIKPPFRVTQLTQLTQQSWKLNLFCTTTIGNVLKAKISDQGATPGILFSNVNYGQYMMLFAMNQSTRSWWCGGMVPTTYYFHNISELVLLLRMWRKGYDDVVPGCWLLSVNDQTVF